MLPDATSVQESLTSLFNPFWELPDQTFLRLCTDDLKLLSEQVTTSTKDLPPQYANEAAITSAAVASHAIAVCAFIQQQPHLSHEEVIDHIEEAMPAIRLHGSVAEGLLDTHSPAIDVALTAHLTTGFLAIMRRHRDRLNAPDTDNDRRPQHYQLLKHIAEIISRTSEETADERHSADNRRMKQHARQIEENIQNATSILEDTASDALDTITVELSAAVLADEQLSHDAMETAEQLYRSPLLTVAIHRPAADTILTAAISQGIITVKTALEPYPPHVHTAVPPLHVQDLQRLTRIFDQSDQLDEDIKITVDHARQINFQRHRAGLSFVSEDNIKEMLNTVASLTSDPSTLRRAADMLTNSPNDLARHIVSLHDPQPSLIADTLAQAVLETAQQHGASTHMMHTLHKALDWEPQHTLDNDTTIDPEKLDQAISAIAPVAHDLDTFLNVMYLLGKQEWDEQEIEDITLEHPHLDPDLDLDLDLDLGSSSQPDRYTDSD